MGQLDGKVAVVVGASGKKNFGASIARRLAEAGAKVVVSARRAEPLEELASEINGLAVACDVTDESQIENLFDTAKSECGRVDIAVNSSGGLGVMETSNNVQVKPVSDGSANPTFVVPNITTSVGGS